MGHGHQHGSVGTVTGARRRPLQIALGITVLVMVIEIVGSVATGSLALLADAGHMATDAVGLTAALVAVAYAQRPTTPERTYGYVRAEVLAALLNGVLVLAIGVYIVIEAIQRWRSPQDIDGPLMLGIAVLGLAANAIALLALHRDRATSLNLRGAYLEVLGDLLGSIAVIVAALLITFAGLERADVIASVLIAALIIPRALTLLRDVVDVLMEATPRDVNIADVRRHIVEVEGVVDIHDLHVWTLTSGMPVLSVHVVVDDATIDSGGSGRLLDRLGACLADHFDVDHCTFQIEPVGHADHEATVHP